MTTVGAWKNAAISLLKLKHRWPIQQTSNPTPAPGPAAPTAFVSAPAQAPAPTHTSVTLQSFVRFDDLDGWSGVTIGTWLVDDVVATIMGIWHHI